MEQIVQCVVDCNTRTTVIVSVVDIWPLTQQPSHFVFRNAEACVEVKIEIFESAFHRATDDFLFAVCEDV
ncbi:hypothetical protein D3874_11955 [Oleomonas cavernae]|uniref:Uncharacterized protein n=1 Tax=Oleomonas cavernae TaxID=2320859 RepID=A0A418WCF3_9PROT|nr:hypothetical protein D3874_11955 [Oleomonas cavernae]